MALKVYCDECGEHIEDWLAYPDDDEAEELEKVHTSITKESAIGHVSTHVMKVLERLLDPYLNEVYCKKCEDEM